MPRKNKTPSGRPAQDEMKSVPGVVYGEGQEIQAMQENMPNVAALDEPLTAGPGGGGQAMPSQATMQEALMRMPTGGQMGPTTRPGEPITAGLPMGPGAGPSMVPGRSQLGVMLDQLARATGDQMFADMARKANL